MPSSRKLYLSEADRYWWRITFESIKQIPRDEWIRPNPQAHRNEDGHGNVITEQYMLFGRGLDGQ